MWTIILMILITGLVAVILYTIIGLIAPANNKLSGRSGTRKNVLIHGLAIIGGWFVLILAFMLLAPSPQSEEKTDRQPSSPPQTVPETAQQENIPSPEEQIAAFKAKQAKEEASKLAKRKNRAWRDCRDYISTAVTRPLTVDVGMFDSQKIVRDKKIVIVIDFTAKNALDIAQPLRAYCEYWQPDMSRTAARIISR